MAQSTPPPPPPQQPPWQPPLPPQLPPKPRNNNRPLIIALAISLPVLLLIILVAVVASSSGDDSDDPHSVAEQFVDGINSGDTDGAEAAEAALCADAVVWPLTLREIVDSEPDVRLTDQVEGHHDPIAGGGAMGHVDGTAAAGPHPGGMGGTLFLDQPEEGGPWCISEVRMGYADI